MRSFLVLRAAGAQPFKRPSGERQHHEEALWGERETQGTDNLRPIHQ